MKAQIGPTIKARLIRGAFYLLLLLTLCVIPFTLGQRNAIDAAKMSLAVGISAHEAPKARGSPTPAPEATAVVVWDQYNNAGTAVTLSATFFDAPEMNSDLADDFDVQGYAWIVRWIDVDAAYFNGPGPADSFAVSFYADNDGFPGNQVYASSAWWEQNGSTFRVHLCDYPPCQPVLYPGRYWVEIQARMTAKCCGEWGWTDRTITNLNPAVWRNPSGFFGACTNWSRRGATCGLDPSAPDQVYRIYANLLPTPTATPITPSATPSASEAQCTVISSQPACDDTVITQLTDFVLYIGALVEPSSVQPSDFTVNGIPANQDEVGGTGITFHFNASPVVRGQNTMHAGGFICEGSGHSVAPFTCAFTYQPSPTPRVAPTPRVRPTPPPRP